MVIITKVTKNIVTTVKKAKTKKSTDINYVIIVDIDNSKQEFNTIKALQNNTLETKATNLTGLKTINMCLFRNKHIN